jgi:pimeloyl-ACP methyl ester carboxylesterase
MRVLRAIAAERGLMLEAAEALPGFDRPALVVWAGEDRVMPPEHGRRLADLLPQGRVIEIPDSYTLIPLDQPARLAEVMGAA